MVDTDSFHDDEMELSDGNEDMETLAETLSGVKEENVWITFWNDQLCEMGSIEYNSGDVNKYYMPKYFDYFSRITCQIASCGQSFFWVI